VTLAVRRAWDGVGAVIRSLSSPAASGENEKKNLSFSLPPLIPHPQIRSTRKRHTVNSLRVQREPARALLFCYFHHSFGIREITLAQLIAVNFNAKFHPLPFEGRRICQKPSH